MHLVRAQSTASDVTLYDDDSASHIPPPGGHGGSQCIDIDRCENLGGQQLDLSQLETQWLSGRRRTPVPVKPLAALCAIRLVDPIAFTVIFPFVNEMIEGLGLPGGSSQTGMYSGLVESVFALAQLLSIYHWAKFSDTFGRRPIIFAGTLGLGLASVTFGLSTTLPMLLLSRALGGLFSGNVAVIHSVLGELTDATNQAVAFPVFGLFWPLGAVIGPLLGGALSNPAGKFGGAFDLSFLRLYPYFLPCFVAGLVAFLSTTLGYYFLDETLPAKCTLKPSAAEPAPVPTSYGSVSHPGSAQLRRDSDNVSIASQDTIVQIQEEPQISLKALLANPLLRALCASGAALCFVATAFDVVFVLLCYSPLERGGLSLPASEIGYCLAVAGALSASLQLFVMPTLLKRMNTTTLYNACMALWPLAFAMMPLLNIFTVRSASQGLDGRALVWTGIAATLLMSRIGCLAYSVNMMLIKENAPPCALGRTNGVAQFAQCAARAFAPAFVSSLFALSTERDWLLGGHAWAIVMALVAVAGFVLGRRITTRPTEEITRERWADVSGGK